MLPKASIGQLRVTEPYQGFMTRSHLIPPLFPARSSANGNLCFSCRTDSRKNWFHVTLQQANPWINTTSFHSCNPATLGASVGTPETKQPRCGTTQKATAHTDLYPWCQILRNHPSLSQPKKKTPRARAPAPPCPRASRGPGRWSRR